MATSAPKTSAMFSCPQCITYEVY